jgi:hypothetical protein
MCSFFGRAFEVLFARKGFEEYVSYLFENTNKMKED